MGKPSRDKGARGEREVAAIMTEHGFPTTRNARNGLSTEDVAHSLADLHIEVKRTETMSFPKWIKQAEGDALDDRTAIIVHRSNGGPWRALVPFEWLLELMDRAEQNG